MLELMNKVSELNNKLDKQFYQDEIRNQSIELTVVEPPSPAYEPPQVNPLTYQVKMHNNMAQCTPMDDGFRQESYKDESKSKNLNDKESLGANVNVQEEESPVDSHPTFASDPREDIIEEDRKSTRLNSSH